MHITHEQLLEVSAMKKRILSFVLCAALCASLAPLTAAASAINSGWPGWENWEFKSQDYYNTTLTEYYCLRKDLSLDEIGYCVSKMLAEYARKADDPDAWVDCTFVFEYSSREKLDTSVSFNNFDYFSEQYPFNEVLRKLSGTGLLTIRANSEELYNHESATSFKISFRAIGNNYKNYGYENEALKKLLTITESAKAHSATARGQLEYINKYLIDNVRYGEYAVGEDVFWSFGDLAMGGLSTEEALVDGYAVCEGYTSAVSDLCFLLGIPNITLTGNDHEWNCVYVDGQWKMLDVTWNDTTGKNTTYFLVDSISGDTHDYLTYDDANTIDTAKKIALDANSIITADTGAEPPAGEAAPSTQPQPAPDTPSSWAVEQVNAAIAANLVPQSLQSKYTLATTRAEFCALAVALYEKVDGKEIATNRSISFSDTTDINVHKAATIGVVSGVGDNRFDPTAQLTREQAATMLSRLADSMGKPLIDANQPSARQQFSDIANVSSWAVDAVGQVQAAGIMSGVGNNTFAPKDSYTREQSIITIVRLFDVVK
jgi:hypothetical protein